VLGASAVKDLVFDSSSTAGGKEDPAPYNEYQ